MSSIVERVIQDEKERRSNAIDMFRPTEYQEQFLRKFAEDGPVEFLVGGGNRCLAGCQEIYDPVLNVSRRVDEIDSEFHVWSRDPSTGERVIAKASAPFVKGFDKFYEILLSNGQLMVVTGEHLWLSSRGNWVSVNEMISGIHSGLADGEFLSGFSRDRIDGTVSSEPVSSKEISIVSYYTYGHGPVWDFEVKNAGNYECAGVLNHNSGKTTVVSVAVASMLLNHPMTMRDGTKLHMRPERWRNEPIKCWVVAFDWRHVGKTIWRVLFKPDLFRVIRDQKTGRWRAWDPSNEQDKGLFKITRPSPPLIRMTNVIDGMTGISWMDKKERQISACTLTDGTRMEFFPSTGAKPQGDPAALIWIDEKIDDDRWYSELLVRLIDNQGRMVWTSWPDTQPSAALSELEKRATDQLGKPEAKAFAYRFKGSENPYTKNETRDYVMSTMDEDTRKARDEGTMNLDRWRVYPRFSRFIHRAMSGDESADDKLAKAIRKHNCVPPDWTRYMIFDPGTANPGVLFVAVPPPEFGDFVVPYDEIYAHYQNAEEIAKLIKGKTEGQFFEDFIADAHACRQTPMGFSGTVGENYEKYLAQEKLTCRRHGSHFSYGDDAPLPRIMKTQGSMNIRSCGTPRLRILGCPKLCEQLEVYRWAADAKGNPIDKPYQYQKVDLAVCLEYFFSRSDCVYVKRPNSTPEDRRSPKSVAAAINQFLGTTPKKKDDSVYCGAGIPIR